MKQEQNNTAYFVGFFMCYGLTLISLFQTSVSVLDYLLAFVLSGFLAITSWFGVGAVLADILFQILEAIK